MSFDFKPDSQQQIPDMPPPQERVGRFSITIGAAFVLLLVVWFAWNPVATAVKAAYGRRCAREARAALGAKEWSRAVEQTIAARRWAPEDVEVIRVVIEFLKVSGSDPGALVQQLRKLAEKQPLTEEEQMLLGRTLAATLPLMGRRATVGGEEGITGAGSIAGPAGRERPPSRLPERGRNFRPAFGALETSVQGPSPCSTNPHASTPTDSHTSS